MDIADASTNDIDGDFDLKSTVVNAGLNGVCGAVNQAIVNKYASGVTAKILSAIGLDSSPKNVGTVIADFVIREIVSKEGVKLPAYAVEAITKSVVQTIAGIKNTENKEVLNKEDMDKVMEVVSQSVAKSNKKA